ncbi:MAG TPA: discoidin domain-containing protein [Pilimelia sp.]|nr:discoidin domain-containing protein [Pilimelia sp.]
MDTNRRSWRALGATATIVAITATLTTTLPGGATAAPAPPSLDPQLITTIDTTAAGTGARALLGDVSGDGRLDLVLMQPTYSADDRFIGRQVQALTAYDIGTGALLWQIGTPDPRVTNNGTDIPAEIYDIDADGDNDVLAVMNDEFRIFEGGTGQFTRSFALPDPEAHDTIVIANFRGTARPQDILLKDRYNTMWALDSYGNLLWTHSGVTGHRPYPHDFDDDGRQELIGGYDFLGPDGDLRWTADMADHPDSIGVGDIDGDGREDIIFGGAGLGGDSTNAYRSDGSLLWRNLDAVEAQQVGLGDFRPDLPGLETAGLDRVNRTPVNAQDSLYLVSATGETLWKEARPTIGCFGTVMEPLHNWDGTYGDLLLGWNRGCGEIAGIWDGAGNRVATFPVDGRMVRGDICGDDRTEVLNYVMGEAARVYANGPCDLAAKVTGRPLPQAKKLYNYTRYTAEEIPQNLSRDRRAGASSSRPRHRAAAALDGDPATTWQPARRDRSAAYRVDLGRLRELTGIVLDRGPGRGLARYRVQVSADGRDWVTVVDRTRQRPSSARIQRQDFTALGRYVRITGAYSGLAEVSVLGTR